MANAFELHAACDVTISRPLSGATARREQQHEKVADLVSERRDELGAHKTGVLGSVELAKGRYKLHCTSPSTTLLDEALGQYFKGRPWPGTVIGYSWPGSSEKCIRRL